MVAILRTLGTLAVTVAVTTGSTYDTTDSRSLWRGVDGGYKSSLCCRLAVSYAHRRCLDQPA